MSAVYYTQRSEDSCSLMIEPEAQAILNILADGCRHHLSELHALQLPNARLCEALEQLLHEEQIHINGAFIIL